MRVWIAILAAAPLLFGCSAAQKRAMDESIGVGGVTTSIDSFDGTRRVVLRPARVSKPQSDTSIGRETNYKIGAEWASDRPGIVHVIVRWHGGYINIEGVAFNVDGQRMAFETRRLSDFDSDQNYDFKESIQYVAMPLKQFMQVAASDDVNVRVLLSGNRFADADLSPLSFSSGAPTARHYMKEEFLPVLIREATLAR